MLVENKRLIFSGFKIYDQHLLTFKFVGKYVAYFGSFFFVKNDIFLRNKQYYLKRSNFIQLNLPSKYYLLAWVKRLSIRMWCLHIERILGNFSESYSHYYPESARIIKNLLFQKFNAKMSIVHGFLRNFVIVGFIGLLIHECCYCDEHVYGEPKSGI